LLPISIDRGRNPRRGVCECCDAASFSLPTMDPVIAESDELVRIMATVIRKSEGA
jgi:hypothetical protein